MNYTGGTWHDYGDGYYECGHRFNIVEFETRSYICAGFNGPAHKGHLKVIRHRTIPLKMQIRNRKGDNITPDHISVPPELVIQYIPEDEG